MEVQALLCRVEPQAHFSPQASLGHYRLQQLLPLWTPRNLSEQRCLVPGKGLTRREGQVPENSCVGSPMGEWTL